MAKKSMSLPSKKVIILAIVGGLLILWFNSQSNSPDYLGN